MKYWAYGLVEDRSLGMRKAAGSIPARSIIDSYYGKKYYKQINRFCIFIKS